MIWTILEFKSVVSDTKYFSERSRMLEGRYTFTHLHTGIYIYSSGNADQNSCPFTASSSLPTTAKTAMGHFWNIQTHFQTQYQPHFKKLPNFFFCRKEKYNALLKSVEFKVE